MSTAQLVFRGRSVRPGAERLAGFGRSAGTYDLASVVERVRSRLGRLPADADEIAAYLYRHDVTGSRGSCPNCPLANYLSAGLDASAYRVQVDDDQIQIVAGDRHGQDRHVIDLPPSLRVFLHRFDRGRYPFLVESMVADQLRLCEVRSRS